MRTTSCTPSNSSNSRVSIFATSPTTPRTVCSVPVERWTSKPRVTSSAMTRSMFVSAVCFSITMTMLISVQLLSCSVARFPGCPGCLGNLGFRRFAYHAARFVDDAFKKPPHRLGVERALARFLDVMQHVLLALGGVNGEAECAFDLADFDGVFRALI